MVKLAAIADDLTGANDTALQFAKRNIKSCVKMNMLGGDLADKDVIVLDSDSRDMTSEAAYEKVKKICELIKTYDAKCIYKKIDSTMRGNIGAEIKAADDVFEPELVMIAPAYPLTGRITMGGHHLLHGKPLDLTEIANAPKTPVKESYIPNIISRQVSGVRMEVLDYTVVRQGAEAVKSRIEAMRREGVRWFICDVAEDANFTTIMDAVKSFNKILWVGSAGLADYITYFYDWQGQEAFLDVRRSGPALICAGSVSHVTQQQIKSILEHEDINFLQLDINDVLEDEIKAIKYYVAKLNEFITSSRQKNIIIATAKSDDDVKAAVCAGQRYGLTGRQVSEKIADTMAKIVAMLDLNVLSGMVLTGGDIAVHVCRAIGAQTIEIVSEIDAAIPLGWVKGAGFDKLFVVTKAGAFGKPDAFIKSVKALRNYAKTAEV